MYPWSCEPRFDAPEELALLHTQVSKSESLVWKHLVRPSWSHCVTSSVQFVLAFSLSFPKRRIEKSPTPRTHTHTHTHSLSLCLSLSLTYTHTNTHTREFKLVVVVFRFTEKVKGRSKHLPCFVAPTLQTRSFCTNHS